MPATVRSRWLGLVTLIVASLIPRPVHADWLFSVYAGAAATASNTVDITPASGPSATVGDIDYEGRAFESPIYYGYRIGWTPAGGHLGVEAEFTHAKAIATRIPASDLTALQLSHGLNFILGNVAYRTSPRCGGRCAFVARGGAGITVPHVEATFRGRETYSYQYAGFAAQGGVGAEVRVLPHLYAVADARLTHARVKVDLTESRLSGPFTSRHVDFGVAWRSAN